MENTSHNSKGSTAMNHASKHIQNIRAGKFNHKVLVRAVAMGGWVGLVGVGRDGDGVRPNVIIDTIPMRTEAGNFSKRFWPTVEKLAGRYEYENVDLATKTITI
jgi:hypothetical protein